MCTLLVSPMHTESWWETPVWTPPLYSENSSRLVSLNTPHSLASLIWFFALAMNFHFISSLGLLALISVSLSYLGVSDI